MRQRPRAGVAGPGGRLVPERAGEAHLAVAPLKNTTAVRLGSAQFRISSGSRGRNPPAIRWRIKPPAALPFKSATLEKTITPFSRLTFSTRTRRRRRLLDDCPQRVELEVIDVSSGDAGPRQWTRHEHAHKRFLYLIAWNHKFQLALSPPRDRRAR